MELYSVFLYFLGVVQMKEVNLNTSSNTETSFDVGCIYEMDITVEFLEKNMQ